MADVHDHALLTEFAAYVHALGGEGTSASITAHIDDFLAARQPPSEPASGIYIPGPDGPIRVDEDRVGEFVAGRMEAIHAKARPARIHRTQDAQPAPQR